ncbi:MAG: hypothetical protein DRP08_03260 [Candidatus Aenigmatarchaeota archaeon]|nr:MAG: hypothetical protein DRP08_03260 [Candidatus Aenigmarchaeota archaeon]
MFLHIGNRGINVELVEQIEFKGDEIVIFFVGNDFPLIIDDQEKMEEFKYWWENKAQVYTCSSANYGGEG